MLEDWCNVWSGLSTVNIINLMFYIKLDWTYVPYVMRDVCYISRLHLYKTNKCIFIFNIIRASYCLPRVSSLASKQIAKNMPKICVCVCLCILFFLSPFWIANNKLLTFAIRRVFSSELRALYEFAFEWECFYVLF